MNKIVIRATIVALCGAFLTAAATLATAQAVVHSNGFSASIVAVER